VDTELFLPHGGLFKPICVSPIRIGFYLFCRQVSSMEKIKVCIQKIVGSEDIPLPTYMTEQAAGMDICAAVSEEIIILPGQRQKIPTGIMISLPEGYEAQIRPRSGLAINQGITLLNSPGTIDADYRGEIALIVINHGSEPFTVTRRMRLAQMVVQKIFQVDWVEASELDNTSRGSGGFGHT
jgi:dUTP pyrophosphatase